MDCIIIMVDNLGLGYDISQYADNQITVYIHWGYAVYGSSDTYPESGWNIDDVEIIGER